MCRLFAVHATKPFQLAAPFEGLARLSTSHRDGWGVAKFDGAWELERSTLPAHASPRFALLGAEPSGDVTLAHIRWASVGAAKDMNNQHPFVGNGWVFMHNGTLENFDASRAKLEAEIAPEFRIGLKGTTDSERCFALFLTFLQGRTDVEVPEAARALTRVMNLAAATCDEPGGYQRSSMNFIASNGKITVATRRGQTLFSNQGKDAVSLSSTNSLFAADRWEQVPEDGVLAIDDTLKPFKSSIVDWR